MRLGSEQMLAFDLEPAEPSWEAQGPGDAGPWAALRIVAGQRVLTRALIPSEARVVEHVHVPLAPLCDWWVRNLGSVAHEESAALFRTDVTLHESLGRWNGAAPRHGCDADTWEDTRFEWYGRHFWLAGAEGAWVPDLGFVRSDDRLWISHGTPRFLDPSAPAFAEPQGVVPVPWADAAEALSALVSFVGNELVARGLGASYPWAARPDPLAGAMAFTAAQLGALLLGDSKRAAADLLEALAIAPDEPADRCASLQALRDLRPEAQSIASLAKLEARSHGSQGRGLHAARAEMDVVRLSASMELAGQDAARTIRELLGNVDHPLDSSSLEALLTDRLGVALEIQPISSTTNSGACIAREGRQPVAVLFDHARTKKPWVRRMEEARLAAHLLLDPMRLERPLGAGSSIETTGPRRRRSGAFAAELLLPRLGIESVIDELDMPPREANVFSALMERFGVGAKTAAFQLWNHGFLASKDERDELIEQYAHAA